MLRNLGYERLTVTYLVGMANDSAASVLPGALAAYVGSEHGRAVRFTRAGAGARWRSIGIDEAVALAADAVVVLAAGLDRAELVTRALKTEFEPGLPLRIFVSGPLIAFAMPHALYDGTAASVVVDRVLERTGATPQDTTPRPVEQQALRKAMKKTGVTGFAGIQRARSVFRERNAAVETPYQLSETLTKEKSVEATRLVSTTIDRATLAAVAASAEQLPDGRRPVRAPASIKLASIVLGALRDSNPTGAEFPVVLPIDARRFATRGTEVEGNFSPSIPIGRLMSDDWSASTITTTIGSAIKEGLPVVWLLASALLVLKGKVMHPFSFDRPLATTPRVPFEVHLSMPSVGIALPDQLFDKPQQLFVGGSPGHGDFALGVWVELFPVGETVNVTVRDETGLIDIPAFEGHLTHRIEIFTGGG